MEDTSPELSPLQKNHIQKVCGKFLYNGRAVDSTLLHALNELSIKATTATETTQEALMQFLDYCASNPDATIIYRASDMILSCDSDAAYLVAPKSRSRAGGYHYLGNKDGTLFNGPVYILAKIIKAVMASAAEAEVGGLYMNAQELSPMRTTLEELNHPQPPTPIRTDNSTADGIMNKTIKQKQSKAMDKRFYWLQDRIEQKQFRVFWAPGKENLADYYTKNHSPSTHKRLRPIYTYIKGKSPTSLQGCVEILTRTDKLKPETVPSRVTCTNKLKPSPKPAPVTYTDKRKPIQLPLPTQMTDDKRKPIQLPLPAQMTDSNGKTSNGILHSNRFKTKLYKLTHELQRTMLNRLV